MIRRIAKWQLLMTVPLVLGLAALPAQAAVGRDLFAGEAYGSYSFVGKTATSGKTAFVVLGCKATPGTRLTNTTQSSEEGAPEGSPEDSETSHGSVSTAVAAIKNATLTESLSNAVANNVSLLGGRITASRAKAVSGTISDARGIRTSSGGSTLSDLVVDGDRFETSPGPNTLVELPKVGFVVFNEQFSDTEGAVPFLVVNMIHVYVTEQGIPGIPVGSQMIVSRAYSALKQNIPGIVGGLAYGHKLLEGSRIQSGPSAIQYMPCLGTGGETIMNPALGGTQGTALNAHTIKTTANGTVSGNTADGLLTSTVESVSLLGGLITADAVRAVAHATRNGSSNTFSDAGSRIVNLVVAGRAIEGEGTPNRQIRIPGLGILWIHRVIQTPSSIEVRMLDLEVTDTNPFNIKPGSKALVAVALATVAP